MLWLLFLSKSKYVTAPEYFAEGTVIAIRPLALEKYRRRNVKAVAELFHLLPVELSFLLQD